MSVFTTAHCLPPHQLHGSPTRITPATALEHIERYLTDTDTSPHLHPDCRFNEHGPTLEGRPPGGGLVLHQLGRVVRGLKGERLGEEGVYTDADGVEAAVEIESQKAKPVSDDTVLNQAIANSARKMRQEAGRVNVGGGKTLPAIAIDTVDEEVLVEKSYNQQMREQGEKGDIQDELGDCGPKVIQDVTVPGIKATDGPIAESKKKKKSKEGKKRKRESKEPEKSDVATGDEQPAQKKVKQAEQQPPKPEKDHKAEVGQTTDKEEPKPQQDQKTEERHARKQAKKEAERLRKEQEFTASAKQDTPVRQNRKEGLSEEQTVFKPQSIPAAKNKDATPTTKASKPAEAKSKANKTEVLLAPVPKAGSPPESFVPITTVAKPEQINGTTTSHTESLEDKKAASRARKEARKARRRSSNQGTEQPTSDIPTVAAKDDSKTKKDKQPKDTLEPKPSPAPEPSLPASFSNAISNTSKDTKKSKKDKQPKEKSKDKLAPASEPNPTLPTPSADATSSSSKRKREEEPVQDTTGKPAKKHKKHDHPDERKSRDKDKPDTTAGLAERSTSTAAEGRHIKKNGSERRKEKDPKRNSSVSTAPVARDEKSPLKPTPKAKETKDDPTATTEKPLELAAAATKEPRHGKKEKNSSKSVNAVNGEKAPRHDKSEQKATKPAVNGEEKSVPADKKESKKPKAPAVDGEKKSAPAENGKSKSSKDESTKSEDPKTKHRLTGGARHKKKLKKREERSKSRASSDEK